MNRVKALGITNKLKSKISDVCCEIATEYTTAWFGLDAYNEDGETFVPEAQKMFNAYYDEIEGHILSLFKTKRKDNFVSEKVYETIAEWLLTECDEPIEEIIHLLKIADEWKEDNNEESIYEEYSAIFEDNKEL